MKKFKELLFLSNIARLTTAKINKNYVPNLSKYKSFTKFKDSLKEDFNEEKLEKALEKTDKLLDQISENELIKIVTILDKQYPAKLKDMGNDAPLFLYVMGDENLLLEDNLVVIGNEKPTLDCQNFEYKFTTSIIKQTERVILTGLDVGCDKIAYTATLDTNSKAIVVLPCGINKIEDNAEIRAIGNIFQNEGCIVSTFAPNVGMSDKGYSTRDELIAILSDCVLAIQFSQKDQTMDTLNFAKQHNRKIACYLPEDMGDGDFSGNEKVLKNTFNTFKINNSDDLEDFIDFLNSENLEKRITYKSKDKRELVLKVNADGQCTFEFE